MKNKYVGCGCGCLLWIIIMLIIIALIGSCTKQSSKIDDIKGADQVMAAAKSCSFAPFTKNFYKMTLEDEKTVFETSLKNHEFTWCGTLIDIKESNGKYYYFVAAYKRHFTGQSWDVFKVQHVNRLPFVVRVETVEDDHVLKLNKGDYISFTATFKERGVNEQGNKQYWQMVYGRDFGLNKPAKKKRLTTYYSEKLKREHHEEKEMKKRQKDLEAKYSIDEDENDEIKDNTEPAKNSIKKYQNCKELNGDYQHGISKEDAVYAYNKHLDGDKDGTACEK